MEAFIGVGTCRLLYYSMVFTPIISYSQRVDFVISDLGSHRFWVAYYSFGVSGTVSHFLAKGFGFKAGFGR